MAIRIRLESCRKAALLTQAQLAQRTGVHQTEISDIELGRRPSPRVMKALAEFFGYSNPEELLQPLPVQLDPSAVRARVEAEFANKHGLTDSIKIRTAAAPDRHGVPPPPSLIDAVRKARGE